MRSLCLLTSRRKICTILVNAVVGLKRSKNPDSTRESDDNVSIFTSTSGKPALGKTYTYLIDTSILLSSLPQKEVDAEMAYEGKDDGSGWKGVGVAEMIKDRNGAREGRWAVFEVVDDIDLRTAS